MTPRSLFNIILKVLGLFYLRDFLAVIPDLISVGYYLTKPNGTTQTFWTLLSALLLICIYGLISYYLIFRSELLIDKLKLDKGFDQDIIPLSLHRSAILSIAIIVIGGYMVATEIPTLCRQLSLYYQEIKMTHGQTHQVVSYLIVSAARVVIGSLLIGNQRQIVNFIERKRKPKEV